MSRESARRIIALRTADLAYRSALADRGELSGGYHEGMERIHSSNAKVLDEIIDTIGYSTVDKVGVEASAAAWLVVQHAIGQPDFMRKCARLLAEAVREGKADPQQLAYLSDRIAVFEGRPQLYGTQFDWNEKGELSPNLYDDLARVNERRRSVGLNTLAEQTILLRQRAIAEQQFPPDDYQKQRADFEAWRRLVGWIS